MNREQLLEQARARYTQLLRGARAYCEDFVEFAFRHEQDGGRLTNQPFHVEWHELVRGNEKSVIFAPVEHAKTQHLGIAKPLHLLGENPNLRGAIVSATEEQALKNLTAIRKHIEENPRVAEVFPGLRLEHAADNSITVQRSTIAKDPSLVAIGVKGAIVGSRLDFLILDDILNFENSRTEYRRAQLLEWVESSLFTRLTEGARVLVIGTPWHPEDLLHVLARRPGFVSLRHSAVRNPDDPPDRWMPIWPEQWPRHRLMALHRDTSESVFLRKYLCRVRVDASGRFRAAWLENMVRLGTGRTFLQVAPKAQGGNRSLRCFTGVDLGVGQGDSDALTVIFTLAVDESGRRLIVNIESGRWTSPDIIERLHRNFLAYGSVIHVESNAAQRFLVQMAQQRFPVTGVHTGATNKHHEEFGVEALAAEIRNGWWVMPSGSTGQAVPEEGRALISEMLHYSPDQHTGDRLMAMWIASEAARLNGMPRAQRMDLQKR